MDYMLGGQDKTRQAWGGMLNRGSVIAIAERATKLSAG